MAVSKEATATRLGIKVRTGVNAAGEAVYKVRAIKGLKTGSSDADVHAIGQALGSLQKYPVEGVSRTDDGDLVDNP